MCPLEKGVRGIETGHQMPGRRIMKRWSCTARSPREDQALLLRRRLPLVPRAASPHGGNLVAEPFTRSISFTPLPAVGILER